MAVVSPGDTDPKQINRQAKKMRRAQKRLEHEWQELMNVAYWRQQSDIREIKRHAYHEITEAERKDRTAARPRKIDLSR